MTLIEDYGLVGCQQGDMVATAHNMSDGREERVARYKEERRRELAAQFGPRESSATSQRESSATPQREAVRSTRASRLRTQAITKGSSSPSPDPVKQRSNDFSLDSISKEEDAKEKSTKKKINRSHTIEPVIVHKSNSPTSTNRRRDTGGRKSKYAGGLSSPLPLATPTSHVNSTSAVAAPVASSATAPASPSLPTSSLSSHSPVPKSSQLVKRASAASPRSSSSNQTPNQGRSPDTADTKVDQCTKTWAPKATSSLPPSQQDAPPITVQKTRVDKSPPKGEVKLSSLPCSPARHPPGILKKSSLDDSSSQPVSILKRKSSRDEGITGPRCLSPLRWSPGIEVSTNSGNNSRGILKKHRSLDEPQVVSIDNSFVLNGSDDTRSILKGQMRRCSLEEVKRNQSPESHPQGILKRKTSGQEFGEISEFCTPQGILKRKGSSPVRCDLANIMREIEDSRRPILKNKSLSEEGYDSPPSDPTTPRPILKKKSFDEEEHPVRPILKTKEERTPPVRHDSHVRPILKYSEEVNGVVLRPREAAASAKAPSHNRRSLDLNFVFRRQRSPTSSDHRSNSISERHLYLESEHFTATRTMRMDDEESCGLSRSGSVSERASMWNKLEQDSRAAAAAEVAARKVPKGTRGRSARGDIPTRFTTQPVTLGEVEQARRNNLQSLDCVEEDEEPSRLSLAERVRLFSGRPPVQPLPPAQSPVTSTRTPNGDVVKRSRPSPIVHSATSSIVSGLLKNIRDKASGGVSVVKRDSISWESSSDGIRGDSEGSESSDTDESASPSPLSTSPFSSPNIGEMVGGVVVGRCDPMVERQDGDERDGASVGSTIAERLAALQRSGTTEWRKRVKPLDPNTELVNGNNTTTTTTTTTNGGGGEAVPAGVRVVERLGKLETASQGWKSRVVEKDTHKFTVAGRMAGLAGVGLPGLDLIHGPRTPTPTVFTPPSPQGVESTSTPVSPEVDNNVLGYLKRSASAPGSDHLKRILNGSDNDVGPIVTVPEVCDESFHSFFPRFDLSTNEKPADLEVDFEHISSSSSQLLVTKKRVRAQRKHLSANPLRALAQRSDLKTEYVEVRSGAVDREIKRQNLDRLSKRNPGLAIEALAGLASKEELGQVVLRKTAESPQVKQVAQWPHPLLIRMKGRRHPVASIVQPVWSSVNQGDTFILVTSSQVFCWCGEFCNVLEKSRATEVANEIQTRKDLGCLTATKVTNLDGVQFTPSHKQFWNILNLPHHQMSTYKGEPGGHPDEDEHYESALYESYRVYTLTDGKLVPVKDYWGKLPKIEVLDQTKVMVFDFVTEVFCWCGKQTSTTERRKGSRVAQELSKESLWKPCGLSWLDKELTGRPSRVYNVTQHMEPVLFREKFADWPDFKVKNNNHKGENGYSFEQRSCDIKPMLDWRPPQPDLVLEGSHLGRGNKFYDEETRRYYQVSTKDVKVWRVEDYSAVEVDESSFGHFSETHSYIIRWKYTLTVTGRELSGEPSKHQASGRDRVAYMTWQGRLAGMEGGAAALLAVGMEPGSPHLTVKQGLEPPSLLHLLSSPLVIHMADIEGGFPTMYLVEPGQDDGEQSCLRRVAPESSSLRSGASMWLVPSKEARNSFLWHGSSTRAEMRTKARDAVNHLIKNDNPEMNLKSNLTVQEIFEGSEPNDFLNGVNIRDYCSSGENEMDFKNCMKMFELSSVKGVYSGVPVPPVRYNPDSSPWQYVYTQEELSNCQSQAVLLDANAKGVWLWVRCSSPPATALTTLLSYANARDAEEVSIVAANSEPKEFTNLFPWWTPDGTQQPLDGWHLGEKRSGHEEVSKLSIKSYPLDELTRHPLPAGVDPTKLELYLEPNSFKDVLGVSKEEFQSLPPWKQKMLKKSAGLF